MNTPSAVIVDHTYLECETAVYHAYVVARQSTADAAKYSFSFECQYGRKDATLNEARKPPTNYDAAKRQYDSTVASKQKSTNDRTYTPRPGTPANGMHLADPAERMRIVRSRVDTTTPNGPDKSTLDAVRKPNWIGVLAERPLINVVCLANSLTSRETTSISSLSTKVQDDARTIGCGIELFGYELDEVFYVANVHDERDDCSVTGKRLQKLAGLIKELRLENIRLCKFAINEERKQQLVDGATRGRQAVFIAADKPGRHQIIKYPQ